MKPTKVAKPTQSWSNGFQKKIRRCMLSGDYRSALVIARSAIKKFPADIICKYQYAKILGDYADELPSSQKEKLKSEAAAILKTLIPQSRSLPVSVRFGIGVNYYYQTEKFREMYFWGKKFYSADRRLSYFAMGGGAALFAYELRESNQPKRSKLWALKSIRAWRKYKLSREKYYFAHYLYSKALALAGYKREAVRSLKKAAQLSKKPISDWEFADVLELI